jgi:hypothetical protein
MNESKYTETTKAVGFAMVMLVAFLLGLAVAQAMSANPAEAGICVNCGGGGGGPVGGQSTPPPPPPTDNFLSASRVPYGQDSGTQANTTSATLESGEPKPYSSTKDCGKYGIQNSVWYKVTPTYTGTVKFSTARSDFDTALGLYQGSSLTLLQQVECSNNNVYNLTDTLTTQVKAGQTYYLQVSGTGNAGFGTRWGTMSLLTDWGCYYSSSGLRLCPIS